MPMEDYFQVLLGTGDVNDFLAVFSLLAKHRG